MGEKTKSKKNRSNQNQRQNQTQSRTMTTNFPSMNEMGQNVLSKLQNYAQNQMPIGWQAWIAKIQVPSIPASFSELQHQMPSLQMPSLQMPSLQMPTLQTPFLQMPSLQMPNFSKFTFSMPSLSNLSVQKFDIWGRIRRTRDKLPNRCTMLTTFVRLLYTLMQVLYHLVNASLRHLLPNYVVKKSLEGQVVMITGATSDIGKLLAMKLALGHKATVICVDADESGNIVDEINEQKGSAMGYTCDVTNASEVEYLGETVGHVNILINIPINVNDDVKYEEKDNEDADAATPIRPEHHFLLSSNKANKLRLGVSAEAQIWTTKTFLPSMMEKNHGHIVIYTRGVGIASPQSPADQIAAETGAIAFTQAIRSNMYSAGKDGVKTTIFCNNQEIESEFFSKLSMEEVADQLIDAVQKNQELVLLPRSLQFILFLQHILPARASDVVKKFFS